MKYSTPEEMLAAIRNKVNELQSHNIEVSMGGMQQPVRGYYGVKRPSLMPLDFYSAGDSRAVATLGRYQIVIDDEYCINQKVEPSPEFCRLQHPSLVHETRMWMREFFGGVTYPIYQVGDRLIMHREVYRKLQEHYRSMP